MMTVQEDLLYLKEQSGKVDYMRSFEIEGQTWERVEARVAALASLAEACGRLIGNYGAGRERGLVEIPSEVLGSILGAMHDIKR